ncbi:hydroxyquinol 1,2-dioxygenase, partial [Burkholderia multivorans]
MTSTTRSNLTPEEVEQRLTETVIASFSGTSDERLKELMTSLVTHLHGFI